MYNNMSLYQSKPASETYEPTGAFKAQPLTAANQALSEGSAFIIDDHTVRKSIKGAFN
jgi:hypothetical protein